jgi:hypothetical protein
MYTMFTAGKSQAQIPFETVFKAFLSGHYLVGTLSFRLLGLRKLGLTLLQIYNLAALKKMPLLVFRGKQIT